MTRRVRHPLWVLAGGGVLVSTLVALAATWPAALVPLPYLGAYAAVMMAWWRSATRRPR